MVLNSLTSYLWQIYMSSNVDFGSGPFQFAAHEMHKARFFATLRMTLARNVILNEVKDLSQNDPLPDF